MKLQKTRDAMPAFWVPSDSIERIFKRVLHTLINELEEKFPDHRQETDSVLDWVRFKVDGVEFHRNFLTNEQIYHIALYQLPLAKIEDLWFKKRQK